MLSIVVNVVILSLFSKFLYVDDHVHDHGEDDSLIENDSLNKNTDLLNNDDDDDVNDAEDNIVINTKQNEDEDLSVINEDQNNIEHKNNIFKIYLCINISQLLMITLYYPAWKFSEVTNSESYNVTKGISSGIFSSYLVLTMIAILMGLLFILYRTYVCCRKNFLKDEYVML